MSVAATYLTDAAVQQQSCSWEKNLENIHPSRVTYENPAIFK